MKRTERAKALKDSFKNVGLLAEQLMAMDEKEKADKVSDAKSPDPKHFSGDPEDLDRFLIQLENKFTMEPRRFKTDVMKIRYTAQLLDGKAHKWYKSYHLQISSKDAYRVRGIRELDPIYATWERFEASLRSSFGERITRDQAVREWHKLRHSDSIDDFIDELNRLMWMTGYEGDVVEDKLKYALNEELGKEWAKVSPKPRLVGEQLALLRDMGHQLEDWYRTRKGQNKGNQPKKPQPPQQNKGKPDGQPHPTTNKPKGQRQERKGGNPDRQTREEALKGIPKNIVDDRTKDGVCLKCGKPNHRWSECWSKDPTVTKVVAGMKRKTITESGGGQQKKGKVAGAEKEEPPAAASGRVIEIPDDIGEDLDIWAL